MKFIKYLDINKHWNCTTVGEALLEFSDFDGYIELVVGDDEPLYAKNVKIAKNKWAKYFDRDVYSIENVGDRDGIRISAFATSFSRI